jgi:hypothetical protein
VTPREDPLAATVLRPLRPAELKTDGLVSNQIRQANGDHEEVCDKSGRRESQPGGLE